MREPWWLQFEPQLTLPVPHGVVAEGANKPAGRCRPGDAGEWPGVDGDMRHLLLQRRQLAALHNAEHIQQAQHGEHLTQVSKSSKVNVIAATQGQMQQTIQLFEDREAVGHQQSAVT